MCRKFCKDFNWCKIQKFRRKYGVLKNLRQADLFSPGIGLKNSLTLQLRTPWSIKRVEYSFAGFVDGTGHAYQTVNKSWLICIFVLKTILNSVLTWHETKTFWATWRQTTLTFFYLWAQKWPWSDTFFYLKCWIKICHK